MRSLSCSLRLSCLPFRNGPCAADFATGLDRLSERRLCNRRQRMASPRRRGRRLPLSTISALLYLDGHGVAQDYAEAVKWFKRSADQGYTEAQHDLGAMYGAGKGVKRDYLEAYKWMNICAAQGKRRMCGTK